MPSNWATGRHDKEESHDRKPFHTLKNVWRTNGVTVGPSTSGVATALRTGGCVVRTLEEIIAVDRFEKRRVLPSLNIFEKDRWYLRPRVRSRSLSRASFEPGPEYWSTV